MIVPPKPEPLYFIVWINWQATENFYWCIQRMLVDWRMGRSHLQPLEVERLSTPWLNQLALEQACAS